MSTFVGIRLAQMQDSGYFAARTARLDAKRRLAYVRTRDHLKPYLSAIVFAEALLLLPIGTDLRHHVWAVDFEMLGDKAGAPNIVGSKVRKLEYIDIAQETDLGMCYTAPEEVAEADIDGIPLVLCQRLPWLDNAHDPVARLRLYLPNALVQDGPANFTLDAIFADRAEALRYQSDMNQHLWSLASVPETDFLAEE